MKKIIGLWSHPRSMSTAMKRIMRERDDLRCAHEPFMYDYYVHRQVKKLPHFDVQPDHPTCYAAIRDMLLGWTAQAPVFFKDMAYYVMPQILSDPEFMARLTHCFLIRNPLASILSYAKLDPDMTLEEIGIEAQWKLYEAVRRAGHDAVVIEAEAVQADAKRQMRALWQRIGLSYRVEAFDWQEQTPADWEQVGTWHEAVSASSGIRPVDSDEAARKQRDFDALAREMPHLKVYLTHHLPFYERLREQAIGK